MKLVVTGAGGAVGTGLRPYLRTRCALHLMARRPPDDASPDETWHIADITDADAVGRAMEGADAVLHLACVHGYSIGFEETLDANYRGTIAVYDAAMSARAKHLVFASSNHGWGFRKAGDTPIAPQALPVPDGWYGISKIWGEAVTAYYAEAFQVSGTSLRIGHANTFVPTAREGRMWVSFRDLAALILLVIDKPSVGHRALWATVDGDAPFFDNGEARALGWVPQDRPGRPQGDTPEPGPDDDIGGAFARANRKVRP